VRKDRKVALREERRNGKLRCAVYTRKSTDEGLEKEFSSLDAQREACEAYIVSQRHEGWVLVADSYDDGGFSGGSMQRPGLKRLLDDVGVGKVDIILVYKVDRLTRALSDFAKIVDILDAAGASFVSITQAFNTTTSMGRLTLNVLLSFAQFEREVISERVRDKVAASKAKGMWMRVVWRSDTIRSMESWSSTRRKRPRCSIYSNVILRSDRFKTLYWISESQALCRSGSKT
jgi:site-specific DNA recombinase